MDEYDELIKSQEFIDSIDRAKVQLITKKKQTFIANILFSLKLQYTTQIPTAGVDGINLFINPFFWDKQDKETQISIMAHESWHVAFKHMIRTLEPLPALGHAEDYESFLFNMAADYVINLMLKDAGFHIPDTWLCDEQFRDMSTEQVYAFLKEEQENDPDSFSDRFGDPSDGLGNDVLAPSGDNTEGQSQETLSRKIDAEVDKAIARAAASAKMDKDGWGMLPGEVQIMIEEFLNPVLDWKTLLQNFMSSFMKDDYSYKKRNRKFMNSNVCMPSLYSIGLGEVRVAVDTSGSVTNEEFQHFISEINEIKTLLNPETLRIIDFDTKVKHHYELSRWEPMGQLEFSGRGGTRLDPIFEFYEDDGDPELLIVFSDLECDEWEEEPPYPVLWICVNNPNAHVNFGTLIHYDTRYL